MEVGGPVTVTDVQVQFDFQANSSMTITISGTKPVDFDLRHHDLSLDIQGDFSPALPTCAHGPTTHTSADVRLPASVFLVPLCRM